MELSFLKLHTTGNDYLILINQLPSYRGLTQPAKLAATICSRQTGVGSQGLILLEPLTPDKLKVEIFDKRGHSPSCSAAALLCAARYAFDSGLIKERLFSLQYGLSIGLLEIIDSNNIRADLGAPQSLDENHEVRELSKIDYNRVLELAGRRFKYISLFIGCPQVVFGQDLQISRLQAKLKAESIFPSATCFSAVKVFAREELQVRSWLPSKRSSVALPEAAGASLVATTLNGFSEREALIHLPTGDLYGEWEENSNHLFVTAAVEYVFEGKYDYEGD